MSLHCHRSYLCFYHSYFFICVYFVLQWELPKTSCCTLYDDIKGILYVTRAPPTLQRLGPVLLDHDAELQNQLRRWLQEGLQQPQHVDVCVLEHHRPVPAPLMLLLPPRHDAQVQRPDVPAQVRAHIQVTFRLTFHTLFNKQLFSFLIHLLGFFSRFSSFCSKECKKIVENIRHNMWV